MTDGEPSRRTLLRRYLSDVDGDVFALTNLDEVVKGAMFARYSRFGGSLKSLLADEFVDDLGTDDNPSHAERLYDRIFSEYGDDSVAQLGGAHVALENISNIATKRIEWGRLAAYLEQSTRYIPYDQKVDGRYRYHREADIMSGPHASQYERQLDAIFDRYSAAVPQVLEWVRQRWPRDDQTSAFVYNNATKAKALDLLRGMLPAATTSNVGMFASGQSFEQLLLRLRADGLAESRALADDLLVQLRTVIPSFLTRVDRPDRGGTWVQYLRSTRAATRAAAMQHVDQAGASGRVLRDAAAEVTLTDFWPRDPVDAEVALVCAALYPHVHIAEAELTAQVRTWSADQRAQVLNAYVGDRQNRRHRPGRGFERVVYRFDVLGDYGGFRDLQRHRMLTIEWQDLTTAHGYETPEELQKAGVADAWDEAMERSAALYSALLPDHPLQAQYAVCFAYRVRYAIQINARAAMQMLELRSTPQGHPQYRTIVQQMHRLIRDVAGHTAVADAMSHVDHGANELERLESERAAEQRRQQRAGPPANSLGKDMS